MDKGLKTIYCCFLIFGIMSIPIFEGYGFPYSLSVFAYAAGFLIVPASIAGLAWVFNKVDFLSWFNVVGSLMFLSFVLQFINE